MDDLLDGGAAPAEANMFESMETPAPAGNYTLLCIVYDAFSAKTVVTRDVTVVPGGSVLAQGGALKAKAEKAKAEGNNEDMGQVLKGGADSMNVEAQLRRWIGAGDGSLLPFGKPPPRRLRTPA